MRKLKDSNAKNCAPRGLIVALLLTFAATVQAQQPPSGQPSLSQTSGAPIVAVSNSTKDDRYRIGPGDLLSVSVLDYAQLSAEVRVDARGIILLPLIEGEIPAACRTEGELAREIGTRYLKYLKEPQVRVFVKDYQSQPVAVLGAVRSPGRFQLQRRLRLLELLTYVNGPDTSAGRSIQIIHAGSSPACEASPNEPDQTSELGLVTLKLSDTLRGEEKANPFVQPGDIVTVPVAEQYYVMGNVARPAAYPIKEPITLMKAIVIAGGTLPDSKTDRVRIIRQSEPGAPKTELVVDLKAIAKQKTEEIMLQPNDIIEVPKAGGATMALKGVLRSFLPIVSQLPLRVIY